MEKLFQRTVNSKVNKIIIKDLIDLTRIDCNCWANEFGELIPIDNFSDDKLNKTYTLDSKKINYFFIWKEYFNHDLKIIKKDLILAQSNIKRDGWLISTYYNRQNYWIHQEFEKSILAFFPHNGTVIISELKEDEYLKIRDILDKDIKNQICSFNSDVIKNGNNKK